MDYSFFETVLIEHCKDIQSFLITQNMLHKMCNIKYVIIDDAHIKIEGDFSATL